MIGLICLFFSIAVFAWSLWPARWIALNHEIQPSQMQLPTPEAFIPSQPAASGSPAAAVTSAPGVFPPGQAGLYIPEQRQIHLDFPAWIHLGSSGIARLTFSLADSQGTTTPDPSIGAQSVFNQYQVMAETRLDLPGFTIQPAGIVSEALLPGQKVSFYWNLSPLKSGRYHGTLWFYLHYYPLAAGTEVRAAVLAQPVEIVVGDFLGLSKPWTLGLGMLSAVLGLWLLFPSLIALLKKWKMNPK